MEQPPEGSRFVGIDVSKDRLDVHVVPSGQAFAVARNGEGLDRLAAELGGLAPALIVLEATGGFELTVAAALAGGGPAAGGGQPTPDPRLRAGHRTAR